MRSRPACRARHPLPASRDGRVRPPPPRQVPRLPASRWHPTGAERQTIRLPGCRPPARGTRCRRVHRCTRIRRIRHSGAKPPRPRVLPRAFLPSAPVRHGRRRPAIALLTALASFQLRLHERSGSRLRCSQTAGSEMRVAGSYRARADGGGTAASGTGRPQPGPGLHADRGAADRGVEPGEARFIIDVTNAQPELLATRPGQT